MKKKIFVLDAFTNGHEAASVFIQRQSWNDTDCEIIFCGDHASLLKRLSEERSYGVVPIKNSIAGEVTEVTRNLSKLRHYGYEFLERDKFDLQINHCLLAPQNVSKATDLERVFSHEKAIAQCGKYLDKIGITSGYRSNDNSTGNAAKKVSKFGPDAKVGAIAPKTAAKEYHLQVLAENIQDVPDNKTTFLLLENKSEVKAVTVGIVGINGGFGQMLKGFFEKLGCKVIGSGRSKPTEFSNEQVVAQSDIVIFCVPIKETPTIIRSVASYTREDQLLMDITSIKQLAVKAMLEGKAQVVGLHPMFRPEASFEGQTVVVCPERLTLAHWKTWVVNVLAATGAAIKWSTPAEHDKYMMPVQVNQHTSTLVNALLIAEAGISVSESLEYASPFYRIMFSQIGRLISQDPSLYTSIVMENPETLPMLERRIRIEKRLIKMIRNKKQAAFEELFTKARDHFGPKVIREANKLFSRLISVLNTLYGKNSATLEFEKGSDRPGLLDRILRVFNGHKVNLTGINSVFLDGKLQFAMSFEQSRYSHGVRRALEEIESWTETKVNILG